MNLLIDIGNSRIKWAIENKGLLSVPSLNSTSHCDFASYCGEHWSKIKKPDKVVVSNVAGPNIQARLDNWLNEQWGIASQQLIPQKSAFGVTNGYKNPKKLGADRWACLLAVKNNFDLPACIVDCGTAITVDYIECSGIHKGGLIIPGFELMERSLIDHTYDIAQLAEPTDSLLGCDTASGIIQGSTLAVCGMIEKIQTLLAQDHGNSPHLILTGGEASRVAAYLKRPHHAVPDLVLRGLAVVL